MKKIFLSILLILISITANAVITEVDGIKYDTYFNEETQRFEAIVIGGGGEEIVIPASIDFLGVTFAVTQIQKRAFSGRKDITSVVMPDCIYMIEEGAFYGCEALTSIIIPQNVKKIDSQTFSRCYNLESVTLSEGLEEIGVSAFFDCFSLCDIDIPNTVTTIQNFAFSGCRGLTSISLPEKLTHIGESAFSLCEKLSSIIFPDSVTYIGRGALGSTSWLENQQDGIIYAGKVVYEFRGGMPENTELEIKEGTLGISPYAFSKRSGLTKVKIPNSVTYIATYAFYECHNLQRVELNCNAIVSRNIEGFGESVKMLSMGGLFGNQVQEYILGNDIEAIGAYCFANCTDLLSVVIPSTVTIINNNAFEGCTNLNQINLPSNLTNIGGAAFNGCEKLISLSLPSSMTSVGSNAFYGLSGLENITLPNSITSIGEGAFSGCIKLSSISIPRSVTSIGRDAFSGCKSLESLVIPENVTIIEYGTFDGCSELIDINIPKHVTEIGGHAFSGTKLSSIMIPSNVSFFGAYAFHNCMELHDVYYYSNSLPSGSDKIFNSNMSNAVLHVPNPSIDLYKSSTPWKNFGSIVKLPEVIYMINGEFNKSDFRIYKSDLFMIGDPIEPIENLEKEGHTFSGWSEIPATMPANDVTVTGTFTLNKYKLTYMLDGEIYKSYELEYKAIIIPEEAPIKESYTFDGWSEIPALMPANDVIITGSFTYIDAIEDVNANDGEYLIYTIDGRPVSTLQKGVNIIRYKNGKVKKVLIK